MKPTALIILDGFAIGGDYGNAVKAANTPNLDRLFASCPHTTLGASGMDVGLPEGQMGNSEVGHTNIGAGRIVYQELTRISKSIADGDFFQNPVLCGVMNRCKSLHLMGLLSDGGVHSHIEHLFALLKLAHRQQVERVYVHCFTDGRDTDPHSGKGYLSQLLEECKQYPSVTVATVIGRYYAMDRDKRYDRLKLAYDAIVDGAGERTTDLLGTVAERYGQSITDEFLKPIILDSYQGMQDGDGVIFFNFRPDRARQLTRALVDPAFDGFVSRRPALCGFVCMTSYDATMPDVEVAFTPQSLANTLGEVLEQAGKTQLRIAETEKYAHVTFFFNGGRETPSQGERRILIPSPKVATYDLKPEMSAYEVTDALLTQLENNCPDVIILNFANCDMVGHTGVFEAAVRACEAVDSCIGRLVDKISALGGVILITADHGNADVMKNPDGSPMTAHSLNPVPFIAVGVNGNLRSGGVLADIAPTILGILNIAKPLEMTGTSLL